MTKEELNGPDVGAEFKQMHGEGMTKTVRRDRLA